MDETPQPSETPAALARRLAADGACVVIADLDLAKAQEAAAEIGNTDVAIGLQVNVTDAAAIEKMVQDAVLAFGGIDIVVNNAGVSLSKPLLETTEKDWDFQHDINLKEIAAVLGVTVVILTPLS